MSCASVSSSTVVCMLLSLAGALDCSPGSLLAKAERPVRSWFVLLREYARNALNLSPLLVAACEAGWLDGAAPAHAGWACSVCRVCWSPSDEPNALDLDCRMRAPEMVRALEMMAATIVEYDRRRRWGAGLCGDGWLEVLHCELLIATRLVLDAAPAKEAAPSEKRRAAESELMGGGPRRDALGVAL